MLHYRHSLISFLMGSFIAVNCVYAAKPEPAEIIHAPSTAMTITQARKTLAGTLKHQFDKLYAKNIVQEVRINRLKASFVFLGDDRFDCSLIFAELKNLSVETTATGRSLIKSNGVVLGPTSVFRSNGSALSASSRPHALGDFGFPSFEKASDARLLVDALLTLKEAEFAPDQEDAAFAAFTAEAKTWLTLTPKPEMPDEARAYKALAEDAFKRKDFAAALEAYCTAIDKFPLWPAGHYNAALLAAETEDYELAAQHMRRYLVLAPDANDASAAKDKLLLWQLKAKQ